MPCIVLLAFAVKTLEGAPSVPWEALLLLRRHGEAAQLPWNMESLKNSLEWTCPTSSIENTPPVLPWDDLQSSQPAASPERQAHLWSIIQTRNQQDFLPSTPCGAEEGHVPSVPESCHFCSDSRASLSRPGLWDKSLKSRVQELFQTCK